MPCTLTEGEFAKVGTDGMSEAEIAMIRKEVGLPYDEDVLRPHLEHSVLERRMRLMAWSKVDLSAIKENA